MPKRKAPPTAWRPGQSGNPDGRARTKIITDIIRKIANEEVEAKGPDGNVRNIKRLRQSTEALFEEAAKGNVAAYNAIAERLEGKVPNENHNTNEVGDNTLQALLEAIDGRSRDIVAPALTEDMPEEEDRLH